MAPSESPVIAVATACWKVLCRRPLHRALAQAEEARVHGCPLCCVVVVVGGKGDSYHSRLALRNLESEALDPWPHPNGPLRPAPTAPPCTQHGRGRVQRFRAHTGLESALGCTGQGRSSPWGAGLRHRDSGLTSYPIFLPSWPCWVLFLFC